MSYYVPYILPVKHKQIHTDLCQPVSTFAHAHWTQTHWNPCLCQNPLNTAAGHLDQHLFMLGLTAEQGDLWTNNPTNQQEICQ